MSLFSIWLSVPVLALGTHLREQSPQYAEYERELTTSLETAQPGQDLAPGVGVGLALSNAWPFVVCLDGCGVLVFTAGLLLIRPAARWDRSAGFLVAGVVGLVGLLGTIWSTREA
jgi:hypothetical protein